MNQVPEVLCAGIIVADHVSAPIARLPAAGELVLADQLLLTIGGCAANVAVDLARQGVSVSVLARVGDDVFGRVVREMLTETGVDVSSIQTTAGQPTSQTLIVNVAGEDRRFIHTIGANAYFRAADIPLEALRQCKILYLGGFFVMDRMVQDELALVFAAARSAGVRTILDVVTPGPGDYLPRLERLLPQVDVFLPNNHEAELMLGEKDPLRQAERFRSLGVGTTIITQGDGGAVLVNDRERLRAGTYPVKLVDGSGGGDAFAAGYITGLLRDLDAAGCLRYASALGASCVRAIGTTTSVFTRAEAETFLARNELAIERV
jgi:sugar/nucleoside kinase (ribokinase family)